MAIIVPNYGDTPGVNDSGFDITEYPNCRICFPMVEGDGATVITDLVAGVKATISNATAIKRAAGGLGFGKSLPSFSTDKAFPDIGGKDLIAVLLGYCDDTSATSSWDCDIGTASGTNPAITPRSESLGAWYTEDYTNRYLGDSTDTKLASGKYGADGFALQYNATVASAVFESFAFDASADTMTKSTGAESGGTTFTGSLVPNGLRLGRSSDAGPNYFTGVLVFTFNTLPSDWEAAIAWMAKDWQPIDANTPGKKRIYPPWRNRTL